MNYIFLLTAAGLVGVDQFIKYLVVQYLPKNRSVEVIDKVLSLTYVENRGAAFSILEGKRWFLIIFTIIAVCVGIYLVLTKRIKKPVMVFAASLMIAGGIGNLIDRISWGFVIDYIDVNMRIFKNFAIFNFADCLVVTGAITMVFCMLFEGKNKKNSRA